jgi:hypothetical protein
MPGNFGAKCKSRGFETYRMVVGATGWGCRPRCARQVQALATLVQVQALAALVQVQALAALVQVQALAALVQVRGARYARAVRNRDRFVV